MQLREYYDNDHEHTRLSGVGRLELWRTKEIVARFLPEAPARVLDVGGGPGAYAAWLAELGHHPHVIDPVPVHVAHASALAGVTAEEGDARALTAEDASWDVVLLLGPLYHLQNRIDRIEALREARRVVRPGGVVVAAGISRFASLLDGMRVECFDDPTFVAIVEEDLRSGCHENPTDDVAYFTSAYFHRPEDLRAEVAEADLSVQGTFAVEGIGWLLPDLDARLDDESRRRALLDALRVAEEEPALLGASAHILTVGRRDD